MRKYGFLIVEGPHDAELAYRLLSPFGIKRLKNEDEVDPFLAQIIPRKYPINGDLQRRMPTPLFVASNTHAIAIYRAEGDTRLIQAVQENLSILDADRLTGMGIILDADSDKAAISADRYARIRKGMSKLNYQIPDVAGQVSVGQPRVGVFVLPDNSTSGTLEDLLIECARSVYPALLESAQLHIATADTDNSLNRDDLKDLNKSSGRIKAIVGAIASVLRPGKAVQVSIQDNKWLRGNCLTIARVKAVQDFLKTLFDLQKDAATLLTASPTLTPDHPSQPSPAGE